MKIGFDIDDTLIDLRGHAFHIYNKKLNKNIPFQEFLQLEKVEIHEPFGLTEEQGSKMWKDSLEEIYFTSCPVYENVSETLHELENEGHEIFYITARPKEHGEQTKQWLSERGFPVKEENFFYGMADHEKIHIIKELQLDYYFDDKPAVVNTLLQEPVRVYLRDQSYNRNLSLPRISHWSELKPLLKE